MSFDQDFPLCGIFAKMLLCLYEYTLSNLFSNFSVSIYIFPVCPVSIFSKVLVWPHFNWLLNYHTFTNYFDEPHFISNRHIYNSTNEVGGRDVMFNSVYPFVVFKNSKLLYTLYIKLDSAISHLCLSLQQSWLLYLKLNRTIAKDCHIGIITFLIHPAYRLVEPWNSLPRESLSHGLPHTPFFLYHELSSFCDFLLFRDDKTCQK